MKMRHRSLPWHHRAVVVTILLALSSLKLIASTVLTNSDPVALAKAIEQGGTVTLEFEPDWVYPDAGARG